MDRPLNDTTIGGAILGPKGRWYYFTMLLMGNTRSDYYLRSTESTVDLLPLDQTIFCLALADLIV